VAGFGILCVCTGNVCRSPVAERLLAHALGADGVRVTSAGTDAPEDEPMAPEMAGLLAARGIDAAGHHSRRLTEADLRDAALVLGMTVGHRSRAVELAPAALRRSFTLTELAAIARLVPAADLDETASDATPSGRLKALVDLAARYRGTAVHTDIDDPIGRDGATYSRVFSEIADAVATIVDVVAAGSGVSAEPGTPVPRG